MKNTDYYNTWEFDRINELCKVDPIRAKQDFENYFKEYPKDYSARSYYIYCLIILNMLDKAQEELNKVYYEFNHDTNYAKYGKKQEILRYGLLINNMRLQSLKGNYKLVCELAKRNKHALKDFYVRDILKYCKLQLGEETIDPNEKDVYLHNQIANYSEKDFLDHIKKHLADYNKDLDNPNKNIFAPDFPIHDVIKEVKKYIPGNTKMSPGYWENVYCFKYEACGRDNNKVVNHFKVICFNNTANIITMLPVADAENFPQIDLSYMTQKDDKIKKTSALERFNRRYKRQ